MAESRCTNRHSSLCFHPKKPKTAKSSRKSSMGQEGKMLGSKQSREDCNTRAEEI